MKKRKISLGVILIITIAVLVVTAFISHILEQALEKEIESIYPTLIAESYIEDVDFTFTRGVFLKNVKMFFLLENNDTCHVKINKIRLGIDLKKFLFNKGKIEVGRVKADSTFISLPADFDSLSAIELESGFKSALRRVSEKNIFSKNFLHNYKHCSIKDKNNKTLQFDLLRIRKKGNKELLISFKNLFFETKLSFNDVKLQMKNYELSSSAVLSNDDLFFKYDKSEGISNFFDKVNVSSRKLRAKLNSVLKFEFFRFACSEFKFDKLKGENIDLSLAGSEEILNIGLNGKKLTYDKYELDSCSFNITADDAGLISRDFKIFTKENSLEASGKLSLKSSDSSCVIFSIKGVDLEDIKSFEIFKRLPSINGRGVFNGVFEGNVKLPDSWNVRSTVKLSKFKMNMKKKIHRKFLRVDFNADSLEIDSAIWLDGELSGGCKVFIDDSVKYNTVFSLDTKRDELFLSRVYELPISFGYDKFKVTTSALNVSFVQDSADSSYNLSSLSTEVLRINILNKAIPKFKRYKYELKSYLKDPNICKVKIGFLSLGKDSVSIMEGRSLNYNVKDSVMHNLNLSYLKMPKQGEFKRFQSSFYIDKINQLKITKLTINSVKIDSLDFKFKKTNKKYYHNEINKLLKKVRSYSTEKTAINIKNINAKIDSLNEIRIGRIFGDLKFGDTIYSHVNITNVKLPDSLNCIIGNKIKILKGKFKEGKNKLYIKDFKLDADGSRYYCDGYLDLKKYLPCSLSVNLENVKLLKHSRTFLKDSTVNIRGGAYCRFKFTGKLLQPNSLKGKGSILLKNLRVSDIPLQKIEIITKYAPEFQKVNFVDLDMNPVVLKPGGKLHAKAVEAKGKELNFKGWGSFDLKGRFYFEMSGKVKASVADKLPNITQLALNKGDKLNYGKFNAKIYGSTKKQYLIPEKGIHGKVIRSKFRQMGASFRNLFN